MSHSTCVLVLLSSLALACEAVELTTPGPDAESPAIDEDAGGPIDDAGSAAPPGASDGGAPPVVDPPMDPPDGAGVIVSSDDPCLTLSPTLTGTDGADT